MGFLTSLLAGTAANILTPVFKRTVPTIVATTDRVFGRPLGIGYRKKLFDQLKSMPFIYQPYDQASNLLDDFVDIDIQQISLNNLDSSARTQSAFDESIGGLSNFKKVMILGDAGMGKTTFMRHTILELLERNYDSRLLSQAKGIVPVYVPLKLVDCSTRFPIARYIESTWSISLRDFWNKLARGKIFLFLDGYDEMPQTDTALDYLLPELSAYLYTGNLADAYQGYNDELIEIFKGKTLPSFLSAAVWFSSRLEFYQLKPIPKPERGLANIVGINPVGVKTNRQKIVENIFSKYVEHYSDILDAELLITLIDESLDSELRAFSSNPLFLTVTSYVYATKRIMGITDWDPLFQDVIIQCIELLLEDLDEAKGRGLPAAKKLAIEKRRGSHVEAKRTFLGEFAFEMYRRNVGSFDQTQITAFAIDYFQRDTTLCEEKEKILAELKNESDRNQDIVWDLINCGVFVFVGYIGETRNYDFPHRRFREVLACRYGMRVGRYIFILERARGALFSELLAVLKREDRFNLYEFQLQTLQVILENTLSKMDATEDVMLSTRNFAENCPSSFDFSETLEEHLKRALRKEATYPVISPKLLSRFPLSTAFIEEKLSLLRSGIGKCLKGINYQAVSEILEIAAREQLKVLLGAAELNYEEEVSLALFPSFLRLQPEAALTFVSEIPSAMSRKDCFLCHLLGAESLQIRGKVAKTLKLSTHDFEQLQVIRSRYFASLDIEFDKNPLSNELLSLLMNSGHVPSKMPEDANSSILAFTTDNVREAVRNIKEKRFRDHQIPDDAAEALARVETTFVKLADKALMIDDNEVTLTRTVSAGEPFTKKDKLLEELKASVCNALDPRYRYTIEQLERVQEAILRTTFAPPPMNALIEIHQDDIYAEDT